MTLLHFAISESPGLTPLKIMRPKPKPMSPICQVLQLILCCFVLYFFYFVTSAIIINGRLWRALHNARFIPDLIQPGSQGPLDIKIHNHLITNKHGTVWNRSN